MVGIYQIRNDVNGKVYYGQTVNFEKRRREHLTSLRGGYHPNVYLQRAWLKYGENAFTFSFVESCPVEKLDEREVKYIAENHTIAPMGYNLTQGGDGVRGFKFSPDQLVSFSERSKRMWENPGFRSKMQEIHRGHKHNEETRWKMSVSHMGKPSSRLKKVLCVETGVVFPAIRKVDLGGKKVCASAISRACKRGIMAYGYHWKHIDDP